MASRMTEKICAESKMYNPALTSSLRNSSGRSTQCRTWLDSLSITTQPNFCASSRGTLTAMTVPTPRCEAWNFWSSASGQSQTMSE